MLPTVIAQEIVIDAPPELVWGVVTEPEQISQWYTDATELDLRPGGAGAFTWKEHGTVPLRVETVDKPSRFAFRWCYPEGAEPKTGNSIRVEFTLTAEGESTRLRVVETELAEVDWPEEQKAGYTEDHAAGWKRHFADLGDYVTRRYKVPVRS